MTPERPSWRVAIVAAMLAAAAACAGRTPPPLPSVLAHPDFVFPSVPGPLAALPGVEGVDRGWRFLQNGDLVAAEGEFSRALTRSPALYPALTGAGYVALARRDTARALTRFDAVVGAAPQYAPALAGRGQALLAGGRSDEALAAFEAAFSADSSLTDVGRRVEVLRLRSLQDVIADARAAAAAGRIADARAAYARALSVAPDSPFLHRELGVVERAGDQPDAALEHFRRAVAADPADRESLVQIGELLEMRGDFDGAERAYRDAAAIESDADLTGRVAAAAERARDARLPDPFRAIPASAGVTRGDLAALIGVRLEPVVRAAPARQEVVTDAVGHWAAPWIDAVSRAGIMPAFDNHTFQPSLPVRRGDLAAAVRQVLLLLPGQPELRTRLAERPRIADMDAGHLSYPAAAAAVATGVLPLREGEQFQVNRPVTGAEAIDAVDRLRALAGLSR